MYGAHLHGYMWICLMSFLLYEIETPGLVKEIPLSIYLAAANSAPLENDIILCTTTFFQTKKIQTKNPPFPHPQAFQK